MKYPPKKNGLTEKQQQALDSMTAGQWTCAYDLNCSLSTLEQLNRKGLIQRQSGVGGHFSPRTHILFRKPADVTSKT